MEEEKKATEANAETIATPDDLEAKNAALEAEKSKLIEEAANYRVAYLKEKQKRELPLEDETEDEKIRRIAQETFSNSRIAQIAQEQEVLIKKALKENKELRLAVNNRTDLPASTTVHSEGQPVRDTLVTNEQLAAFKARGWSDKDIEKYKKNLLKYTGR